MHRILLSLLFVLSPVSPQEKVNPRYEYWANCKVGSWVKYRMTGDLGAQKMDWTVTEKLVELTPEKAVVETTMKGSAAGQAIETPPRKQDVKAKDDKAGVIISEKEEDVTAGGKTLKCRALEYEVETGGGKMSGKAWVSKEIPGGAAKGEFTTEKSKTSIKTETLEWEKK